MESIRKAARKRSGVVGGPKKFVAAKVSEPTNEFFERINRPRKPLRLVALRFPEKNPNGLAELKHACSRGSPLVIFLRKLKSLRPLITEIIHPKVLSDKKY